MFNNDLIAFKFKKKIKITKKLYKLFSTSTTSSRLDCRRLLLENQKTLQIHLTNILGLLKKMRLAVHDFQTLNFKKEDKFSTAYLLESLKFISLRNDLIAEIEHYYCLYDLFLSTNELAPTVQENLKELLLISLNANFYMYESPVSFRELEALVYGYLKQIFYLLGLMGDVNRFEIAIYDIPLTINS